MKISIVIRCFNEEEHIGKLLSGIMQQSLTNTEIIIVDSGSTDATLSIATRFPVTPVTIKSEEFTFGRALNLGCKIAQGDVIIAASAHVYPVCRDWLARLIEPFNNPDIALVYGRQIGSEETKYSEHQVFSKWFPAESNFDQKIPFCNNANAAVRRSVWQQIPYDEFITGLEDLDWASRAMKLGHKIAYSAKAEVVHVHNETSRGIYNRYRREAIAMKHIFPHERFSLWNFFRLYTSNVGHDFYRAIKEGDLFGNVTSIFIFRLLQFWGTYMGYARHGPVTAKLKQRFYYPKGIAKTSLGLANENKQNLIDYSEIESSQVQDKGV